MEREIPILIYAASPKIVNKISKTPRCFCFLQGTVPGLEKKQCSICLKSRTNPEVLPRCRHSFCKSCIYNMPKKNKFCEVCGLWYGPAQGNQPVGGTMTHIIYEDDFLPGYEDYGTIVVEYNIPNGIQGKELFLQCNANSIIDPVITFLKCV